VVTGVEAGSTRAPVRSRYRLGHGYVQRDDLARNAVNYRRGRRCRPPSPRYCARLSFREFSYSLVLDASHHASTDPLGRVHRGHIAEAAALIDAELDRRHGHQRPPLTVGGDPPRPPEVTLRCVRAPRRTEWIPARRVGTLRPYAVPVGGGTSRHPKRLGMPCQPAPEERSPSAPVR
jgi:hypothetical protein